MYYLGIDQHKKYSQVAVINEEGKLKANCKVSNEKLAFESLLGNFEGPYKAVVEAGRSWGKIHDLLEDDFHIETVVANPLKTRAIAEAKIKTDTIDASTLAYLLKADLIPEVHVPPKEIREKKNLLRHRTWLIRLRTMTKNRISQIIDRNHVQLPEVKYLYGSTGEKFMNSLQLSEIDGQLLESHRKLLDTLTKYIAQTEKWIQEEFKDDPMITILDSLPGFGKIFSALITLEVNDINRFSTASKFASYCCLIPTTYASGGKVYHGRLIPTGNKWLKYAFIEGAWCSLRCSAYCKAYYGRRKYAHGANSAIISLARRLSEIAYICLKEKRKYEERPYLQYKI
jgi:transposase